MDQPAVPPPPGQVSDFNAPNTLQKWNVLCQVVCLVASSVVVALRLYTKLRIVDTMRLGLEDYTCFISWLMLLAYAVMCLLYGTKYGGGEHIWNMSMAKLEKTLEFNINLEIIYGPIILFTKMSILLLYAKIFAPTRKSLPWWSIYTLLWSIILFYISITLVKIFECTPREAIWNHSVKGKCVNNGTLLVVTGTINLVTDVFIFILPLFSVWNLQMSLKRRMGVIGLFLFGSLAPIATILRLQISIRYKTDIDSTYALFGISLWTVAEITTGIICSSLPILPAFFRHFYPKIRSRMTNYATGTNSDISRVQRAKLGNSCNTGGYLELEEMDALRSANLVSTEISGKPQSWVREDNAGIIKTIEISQVGEHV